MPPAPGVRKPLSSQTISAHCSAGQCKGVPAEPRRQVQMSSHARTFRFCPQRQTLSLCLTPWPLAVSQCRDAPARTGKREDDEKIADDRTVRLCPCCLEMAWCLRPLPFLGLGVLTAARRPEVCSVRPGLQG